MDDLDQIKQALRHKQPKETEMAISKKDMLSSGATLLNLACTSSPFGCFVKGKYYFFVGDSTSGKTWLALQLLAEATLNKRFDDYRLIHDNVEDGALMDFEQYFGSKVAERIEPPAGDADDPRFSETIEEFYYNVDDAVQRGPCIYILDSMDALTSEDEQEVFDSNKTAHRKGKATKGSYGMSKAKKNSEYLRKIISGLKSNGSILIVINQTRDNVGRTNPFQEAKTRSGGHALKFYATVEMWTSIKGPIKTKVRDKDREQGIYSLVRIKKNRITGRKRSVTIPIYHSFGVDDIGSCVDYLLDEGHWKKVKGNIKAPEFEFVGRREQLIQKIESEELERELRVLVGKVWNEIEEACAIKRKKRYE
jgi:hypothetical protein